MALIDEIIQDAMRKGQFDDLPGAGKPLKLEDDSMVPPEQRMAHKLLRDNGFVPDWMAQGQALDAEREALIRDLRRRAIRSSRSRRSASRQHGITGRS